MNAPTILDITRLFSRRNASHDTGVDRVERAYLTHLDHDHKLVLLLRQGWRVFLFDRNDWLQISQVKHFGQDLKGRVNRYLALNNIAKASKINQNIHQYSSGRYINVGHSAHPNWFWKQLKKNGIAITILIHDVIPLDFPQFTRQDQIEKFRKRATQWIEFADQIITPSNYSKERIKANFATKQPITVSPLSIEFGTKNKRNPENAWLIVGTIEPRKNHIFLIDLWEDMASSGVEDMPKLWIIGARGWENESTFSRLDASPLRNKFIFELGSLTDAEMQDYFARAKGLLFPSHCEGFGLPFFEAILAGMPVLGSDIPPFREAVGDDNKILLPINGLQAWKRAILSKKLTKTPSYQNMSWHNHLDALKKGRGDICGQYG